MSAAQASTSAPDFLVVDQHVARNPVARAIARQRITQAVRDFQTRLYLLEHDERVDSDVIAAAKVVAVALRVLHQRGHGSSVAARVMGGAMGALAQVSGRAFRWHTTDAVAIDMGLRHAVETYCAATALEVQEAHRYVSALEAAA